MAARHFLLNRFRIHSFQRFTVSPPQGHRLWCSVTPSSEEASKKASGGTHLNVEDDDPEMKVQEEEIVKDIQPILMLTRKILHSPGYLSGEHLTMEDERAVFEKLLVYHPHFEDKIGCGLASIMVDHHPLYQNSRCLFVIRTDGSWIDFSYKMCLREYIRDKYQKDAEKFIERLINIPIDTQGAILL
ncbi:protein DCL homolog, chloroplastic isoform X2 [Abrus precatorius]|uniref:Protein DCL homolog, chloroplastic isoform X2 n=1 Tax=Abrus precatorius TaxID=3816 RepID=A0A8B8JK96_ABRPR|nr:protein DCL homolog, chloroplastic isoform X2 [Abrus precatorius]